MFSLVMFLVVGTLGFADEPTFAQLDKNQDGVWSRRECDDSVDSVRRFLATDHDGDLRVTAAEFDRKDGPNKNAAWQAFQRLDVNKDNVLDKAEYTSPKAEKPAQVAAEAELARFDRDENGTLDIAEFVATPKTGLSIELRFRWIDANEDGRLELDELLPIYGPKYRQYARVEFWAVNRVREKDISLEQFKKREAKPARTYQDEFWVRDANDDGVLQVPEFAVWDFGSPKPTTKQLFLMFDADADDKLTVEEFAVVPGVRLDSERVVPDPIQDVYQQTRRDLLSALGDAKERSTTNWPTEKVAELLRDAALAAPTVWDLNADGKISNEELERGLRIGFGFESAADPNLKFRQANGLVATLDYVDSLDADHDGKLGKDEFIARYYQKKDENAKIFAEMDANKDGFADLAEALRGPWFWTNSLSEFQRIDGDFDGRISAEELATRSSEWHKRLAPFLLPAFDEDGDGVLTYREFRRTPPVNRLVNWFATLQDKEADGKLSFAEFHPQAAGKSVLWAGLLRRFIFDRFDRNQNGTLELSEHPFQINLAIASAEVVFQIRDKNGDGQIDWQEFIVAEPSERHPALKQLFAVFDASGDQHLSLDEFRALPGYVRPELRLVPDPILSERDRFLASLQKLLAADDKNTDGEWSDAEWPKPDQLTPLLTAAVAEFKAWDFDGNGQVAQKELQRGVDTAFGIVDPYEGRWSWRFSDGRVFYGLHWQTNDPNRDGKLTREEFLPRFTAKVEDSTKRFDQADTDKDNVLTPTEVFPSSLFIRDIPADYLLLDSNRDGRVDQEELTKNVESWRKRHADNLIPQFDKDGDGALSLAEFRQTPLGNPVHSWSVPTDRNNDGKLDFDELFPDRTHYGPLWLYGLSKSFFDRFDRDRNGTLEFSEYPFQFNIATATAEMLLQIRDKNGDGKIDWQEFTAGEPAERHPALKQLFLIFDADADQLLTLAEFRALPGYVRPELRVVPDPVRDERDKFLASLTETLSKADQNQDHQWTQQEWPESKILTPIVGDATAVAFQVWDFDGNGSVTEEEVQRGVDFTYGLIDPFERRWPWRFPDGVIVNVTHWVGLDKNRDRKLSREEFLVRYPTNPADGEKVFVQIDRDQDGTLSTTELFSGRWLVADSVAEFLRFDADRDGRVSQAEVTANMESWRKRLEGYLLPQFDIDEDGQLSLREFRQSLLGDRTIDWLATVTDANGDGRVAFSEFFPARTTQSPLWMLRQAKFVFDRLDRNLDGQIELGEFPFQINLEVASAELIFQLRDKNGDGKIDWDELIVGQPAERHPALKQLVAVFDADGDQQFTLAEFRALPGFLRPELRAVPDPMLAERDQLLVELDRVLKKSDQNQDGQWPASEWPAQKELLPILSDAAATGHVAWDFDKNGTVTAEEIRRGADLAFGLFDPLESRWPWRFNDGRVFAVSSWQPLDKNKDKQVTREEFLAGYYLKTDESLKRFQQIDRNKDDIASLEELFTSPYFIQDPVGDFLRFDADRNGQLSEEELRSKIDDWRKGLAERVFPQFDRDNDGQLTLAEYRRTPLANPEHNWLGSVTDWDGDDRVSFSEFFRERQMFGPLWLVGLSKSLFDRFDLNRNGVLESGEYPFNTNPAAIRPAAAFRLRDKNSDGKIDWEEFSTGVPVERHPALRQLIAVFDTDGDQAFSSSEFTALPGYFNPEARVVPDPVQEIRDQFLNRLTQVLKKSDANQDDVWSSQEWPKSAELTPILGEAPLAEFKLWDFDSDAKVTAAEVQRGTDLAFGFVDPIEGRLPCRFPHGVLFYGLHWQTHDANRDMNLSRDEFVNRHSANKEENAKRFDQFDTDKDGILSLPEVLASHLFERDVTAEFMNLDKNRDGHVDAAELSANTESWQKTQIINALPQFDEDGDGALSFREYRLLPLGNPVHSWGNSLDQNGNEKLEPQELFADRAKSGPLWLAGLTKMFFDRWDRDHNGILNESEYPFQINLALASAETVFRKRDKNNNGKIDWEELSANEPAARHPALRQLIAVFDANGDQAFSKDEFLTLPGYFNPALRSVPDPLVADRDELLGEFKLLFENADRNRDSQWTADEWPAPKQLANILHDSAITDHTLWDFNKDDIVSAKELRRGADLLFGLIDPLEGRYPWHLPEGRVFNVGNWQSLDKNKDKQVTRDEFLAGYYLKTDESPKRFQQIDRDQNGVASMEELFTSSYFLQDPVGEFLRFDADQNGRLTDAELRAKIEDWRKPQVERVFPQFDADNDGQLTLAEYRRTPLANPVFNWYGTVYDVDGDGRVTFSEFFPERSAYGQLWLARLARLLFDRFDRDHNGGLDLSEYSFRFNPAVARAEAVFRFRDANRDGKVDWSDLSANEPESRHPALRQLLVVFDTDGDQRLSLTEFKALPGYFRPDTRLVADPLLAERDRLLTQLKPILKRSDDDQDGQWSRREWPKPQELLRVLRDLSVTEFPVWDFDGDGSVTQTEIERGADLAFGLIDPLERKHPFHHPDGRVFNGVHWLTTDPNRDRQVTRDEFMARFSTNKEGSVKAFEVLDVDKDGIASATEVFSGTIFLTDVTNDFLAIDADKDGRITPAELTEKIGSWRQRLANHVFPQFDTDGDGKLSLSEFRLTPAGNPVHSWAAGGVDHNGDGLLAFSEFFAERTSSGPLWLHQLSRFYFDRYDVNRDGLLNDSEFDLVGGSDPKLAELGWGPDPIRERYTQLITKTPHWLKHADQDGNGILSRDEWPNSDIVKQLGAEPLAQFTAWDANNDGKVTLDELNLTLRFALGLSSRLWPEGWLRWPNGQLINIAEFQRLDTDQNGRIAHQEFMERSYAKQEDRAKLFADSDTSQDGELTLQEMIVGRRLFTSPWDAFQRLDTDKDRVIAPTELSQNSPAWEKQLAARIFPTFDPDQDGKLSMAEYRLTPLVNPFLSWNTKPVDSDHDGYLSPAEFCPRLKSESPAWLTLFCHDFFQNWDQNHDGKLSLAEYHFTVDMNRLPPQVAFTIRDKNGDGSIVPEELFSDPKPDAKDSAATMAYHRQKMKAEETFLAADKNLDRKLDEQEYLRYEMALRELGRRTKTAVAAGEKPLAATPPIVLPRAGRTWQNWDEWLAYGLTGVNLVLAVVGVGYWMRKRSKT